MSIHINDYKISKTILDYTDDEKPIWGFCIEKNNEFVDSVLGKAENSRESAIKLAKKYALLDIINNKGLSDMIVENENKIKEILSY
ncbi:MAG: hypothetical protein ACOCP8_06260 [archaeon]